MKKTMIMIGVAVLATGAFAGPHGFRGHGGPHFGPRPSMHHHHHHHGGFWGRGGRNFWPGFVGGVVGGILYDTIAPAPVVVRTPTVVTAPTVVTTPVVTTPVITQPVVVQQPVVTAAPVVQNVWVEGRYVDQIQANGTVVRVWQPGHYEQR